MKLAASRQRGFSLVELVIVLTIVGIIFGTGVSTLGAYLDNAKQAHTLGSLKISKRALLDYVKVNRYLPCPDISGDGFENREQESPFECSASVGWIPNSSIGLSLDATSDDYGNRFAYGINKAAANENSAEIIDPCHSASYFAVSGNEVVFDDDLNICEPTGATVPAPVFILETPPTDQLPDATESYHICLKDSANCSNDIATSEVESIPAVLVAFNANGYNTLLNQCQNESGREQENCDGDLLLWRNNFSEEGYDDQMVTISAYEIKRQVLDLLNSIELKKTTEQIVLVNLPDGFDYILNKDLNSTNELNVATNSGESMYISGDVNKSINLLKGNDTIAVMGTINANINGGAGTDRLYVSEETYAANSGSLTDKLSRLQQVSNLSELSNFEEICYFPFDENFADAVCYSP
ncbi:type II secretion system protein [Thiomicrorhabdus sp. 6S2-11]|uniref:Type II secretion system protein n=1 Tax=Thiomicrorhabdus marina TaxID=2818442 RepID=A0ABS3Q0U5_9GAMM|nr:type II secretion system protein [Thiomicrorhabdus marina]MBO1925950.1 type II secretion system protein [Thiomicrorhabdus marina]